MEKSRGSGLLETPALFMPAEFPRRTLLGNWVNRVGGGRIGGVQPPTLEGARRGLGTGAALTRP